MNVTLRQKVAMDQRIDLSGILPDKLSKLTRVEIQQLSLSIGNRLVPLAEIFDVELHADENDEITLIPMGHTLDYIGADMENGRIIIEGDAGNYTGRRMAGGTIEVHGNAGDHSGSGMRAGRLSIDGDTGARAGGPAAGERRGQQGGLIHIRGNTGERAGECMRRGMLMVDGDSGDLVGHRMIAGTLYVGGQAGELAGHGMRRGTLLLNRHPRTLGSTIVDNGRQQLAFLRLLLDDIQRVTGGAVITADDRPTVQRYVGDLACDGRGEILVLD